MKNMKVKAMFAAGAIVLGGVVLGACSMGGTDAQNTANANDVATSASALRQLQQAQPTPKYTWSQLRETLIRIENAQANSTQTTSFFFNQGVQAPIDSCPSIGLPIASTTQLTNPVQDDMQGTNGDAGVAIGQVDPTGVYSGSSTGTYVVCVSPNGSTYINYWEGYVKTVTGPAVWDTATNAVKLTGPSTAHVKTSAKG